MTVFHLETRLLPGWVVDPADGFKVPVRCPADSGHTGTMRDWSVSDCLEPPRPQRRLLARADAVEVAGTGTILLRVPVVEWLRAAGLSGWAAVPARIRLREGGLREDMMELRVTRPAGIGRPFPGMVPLAGCRGCGLRPLAPGLRPDLAAQGLDGRNGDFQALWPMPYVIFVSDRARAVLQDFEIETLDFVPLARMRLRPPGHVGPPPPFWPDEVSARIAAHWP